MDKYSSSALWVILNLELSRLQFVDYNSQTSDFPAIFVIVGMHFVPSTTYRIGLEWTASKCLKDGNLINLEK